MNDVPVVDPSTLAPVVFRGETFHPVSAQRKYPTGTCAGCSIANRKWSAFGASVGTYVDLCNRVSATIYRKHPKIASWCEDGVTVDRLVPRRVCGDVIWVVDVEAYLKARLAGEEYREP